MKQHIASLIRSMPLLTEVAVRVYRLRQSKFSAGVIAVIVNAEQQVLVVEHVYHARYGWGLPGGWLNGDETPVGGVKRECREELGIDIDVIKPILTDRLGAFKHLDIAFYCHPLTEIKGLSSELLDYRWCAVDDLPPLPPFHMRAIIQASAEHHHAFTR